MNFEEDLEKCLEVLRSGGVILYPTDTVWGLGCDATNETAVAKIYGIKNRPEKKSMIVLLADERDIVKYVAHPDPEVFSFLDTVRKPTTIIYQGALGLADNLVHDDGTIAIRLIKEDFCRHLIKRFKKPIVSTSANISGDPAPSGFAEIADEVRDNVDYVVRFRREENNNAPPSTILRWIGAGKYDTIRP